jgi:SAM-dependent methyltransferase
MKPGDLLRRLFLFSPPDPRVFWSARAAEAGWLSVMWRNPAYNQQADRGQRRAIEQSLSESGPANRGAVLDLGCGTGRMAPFLAGLFADYLGVDLPAMVGEAERRCPELAGCFVASAVQDYDFPAERFDLVLSMACLSTACRIEELPAVAKGMARAVRPGGRVVLIDAFHRLPLLARQTRASSREVVEIYRQEGLRLAAWSGLHFVPVRLLFARPWAARFPRLTRAVYQVGERLLALAPRRWCDYSVLVFERPDGPGGS